MNNKEIHITMSDGSVWAVPVIVIATNRAKYYAHEFDGDVLRSLNEDTRPLFESDHFEIKDWAVNNMDWSDCKKSATMIFPPKSPNYADDWQTDNMEVVNIPKEPEETTKRFIGFKIICNKIRCKHCDDIVESRNRHDFRYCKCTKVAVDGGKEYLKRVYPTSPEADYEELCELDVTAG